VKGDVDQLIQRVRGQGLSNLGFMEAIVRQRGAHIGECLGELGLREAGSGVELADAVELGIQRGALGAIHADGSNEGAGSSAENEGNAILKRKAFNLDGFIKAGGKHLAETLAHGLEAEWRALGLGQVAGKRLKRVSVNAIEGDVPYRHPLPFSESLGLRVGVLRTGGRLLCWGGLVSQAGILAPADGSAKAGKNEEDEQRPATAETYQTAAKL
jgi:hypothetical protein